MGVHGWVRNIVITVTLGVALPLVGVLVGCQTPAHSTALTGMPGDFSVEMAVLSRDPERVGEDQPPVARYVIHPNGAMHVAAGAEVWRGRYPHLARQLSTSQMVSIWTGVNQVGAAVDQAMASEQLASEVEVARTGQLFVHNAPKVGVAYYVWWREAGRERGYLLHGPTVQDDAAALAWVLSDLAWM